VSGKTKSVAMLALAIVLSLGLAVSAGYGAKVKRVASEVEVDGWRYDSDDFDFVAVGDVHSNKSKCEKGRTVTVIRNDGPFDELPPEGEGDAVGEVKTDATGDWEFTIETNGGDTPNFMTATVARKKVTTRGGKKLICKADKAPPLLSD
jgi:hypothetical protein